MYDHQPAPPGQRGSSPYPQPNNQSQPYPPQTQPQYQHGYPPPLSPPQHRKISGKSIALIVGVVLLISVIANMISHVTQPSTTTAAITPTAPVARQQKTTVPTHTAPTLVPTTQSFAASTGPAILGAPISAFVGKLGQPAKADVQGGQYDFQQYPNTQLYYVSVIVNSQASASFKSHAITISIQAPPHVDWSATQAKSICESFGPADVSYDHALKTIPSATAGTIDGMQYVYHSQSLASQIATNDFVDGNVNPVTPGTFNIQYIYDGNANKISMCGVSAGISS